MDSYILRIYRREKDDPRTLVGLVEDIDSKGKRAFTSYDDLWEILNGRAGSRTPPDEATVNNEER
jgi:hypothetical protein